MKTEALLDYLINFYDQEEDLEEALKIFGVYDVETVVRIMNIYAEEFVSLGVVEAEAELRRRLADAL